MNINGVGNNSPVHKVVTNPVHKQVPTSPVTQHPIIDRLEVSGMSHLLKTLKTNDVRMDKVAKVKSQIDAGTYETEQKLNAAVDRLLDDLG